MPAAFTADDRARITAALLESGERLFASQGLKKTSLAQLVAPAGIAKASFYAFFASKESLYLEIMIRRVPRIAAALGFLLEGRPDSVALARLMRAHVELLTTDPWYRRLLTHPDELAAVRRRVGQAELQRVTPYIVTPVIEFLRRGQRAGTLIDDVEPTVLLGALRSAGLMALHRDEFGTAYEQVVDTLIEALARGLSRNPVAGD